MGHYSDIKEAHSKIEKEIQKLQEEKQRIVKSEEIKNKEALELSEKLQKLREIQNKTELEILETRKELYKLCTHEKTREENRTAAGGYLDRREYITEYWCELCGIMVDRKVEYGGFE